MNIVDPQINLERLKKSIEELSQIGTLPDGGISRLALSGEDKQARDKLISWLKQAEMDIHVDQVGNITAIRKGAQRLQPVMMGSHIDTVIGAGRYDGCYGVLAALECVRTLNDNRMETNSPIAVTSFTNEEGVRYQPGMLGSAVYSGTLPVKAALAARGVDGSLFGDELLRIGYAGTMECGSIRPSAYLELHIEQGPVLDREKLPIGIVTGVVGISWWEITISGVANHAGTTPMDTRADAGLAAAKLVCRVREIADEIGGNQRATCGMLKVAPNAINVIPGRVILTVDLRNDNEEELLIAEKKLEEYIREDNRSGEIQTTMRKLEKIPAVQFDQRIVGRLEETASALGLQSRRMTSGAGHDAQLLAGFCPAAMLFIPSIGGISHSKDENSTSESLENGANVLLHTMLSLANADASELT